MPLSLTLSAIVDGQQIDAADVTTPFNQVQTFANTLETNIATNTAAIAAETAARAAAVTGVVDGTTAFNQVNLGVFGTTLTIASDAISITKSRHVIDTQGGGATDDLSTISGFAAGDMLFIQTVSAARVVTIKHNVGNIYIFAGVDIV